MSTLKVDGIRSNSASSDAITLASDGTCTANITNRSNRNLIINGAMLVAQRGTSSSTDTNGWHTMDRFKPTWSGIDNAITQAQVDVASGTTPYTLGFRKAFKITNGNQTSVGTADFIRILYQLEAQDLANSGWNYTSSSSYITLSFWIKVSVAQTYHFNLRTYDGTAKMYRFSEALSANTWTKVTHSIPGHADLSFDNDANAGMYIQWYMFRGTDHTGTVTLNQWSNYDTSILSPDQSSTWYTTDDATYEFTGVQLEVGEHATDFEHRSYGQELALCQRYYYVSGTPSGGGGIFMYDSGQTSVAYGSLRFTQTMRATPTVVLRDNNGNTDGKATQHGDSHNIAATADDINSNGFSKVIKGSGNWSTGAGKPVICGCTADAEI